MKSQCDRILEWLRTQGSITPAQAYERFGILAMHSRAAELRERGYNVVCQIKTGNGKRWGEYRIAQAVAAGRPIGANGPLRPI